MKKVFLIEEEDLVLHVHVLLPIRRCLMVSQFVRGEGGSLHMRLLKVFILIEERMLGNAVLSVIKFPS